MREGIIIENTNTINTIESLKKDLATLGLKKGMTVIVHSSLSSIGWVCGGAVSVIKSLMDIITEEGNIIMPAQTGDYSEPCYWGNPPVPEQWYEIIRETMPVFDKHVTPTRGMGRIAEVFRSFPNVLRSDHPQASFTAWGKDSEDIIRVHNLEDSLGETSPLGKVYNINGYVLLLGVPYENNTSFHLSEYKSNVRMYTELAAPILENGKRVWKTFRDIDLDSEDFNSIGIEFEKNCNVSRGLVGQAESRLFHQKTSVDFATEWFKRNRGHRNLLK